MTDQPNLFADDNKPKPKKRGTKEGRRLIFQALCDETGISVKHVTESSRGSINLAVSEIMAAEEGKATVEQVQRVADGFRQRWPFAVLTPSSIKVHWAMFVAAKPAKTVNYGVSTTQVDPEAERQMRDEAEVQARIDRAERVKAIPQADYRRIHEKALAGVAPAAVDRAAKVEAFLNLLICEVLDAEATK